jgi:hypothetical protein
MGLIKRIKNHFETKRLRGDAVERIMNDTEAAGIELHSGYAADMVREVLLGHNPPNPYSRNRINPVVNEIVELMRADTPFSLEFFLQRSERPHKASEFANHRLPYRDTSKRESHEPKIDLLPEGFTNSIGVTPDPNYPELNEQYREASGRIINELNGQVMYHVGISGTWSAEKSLELGLPVTAAEIGSDPSWVDIVGPNGPEWLRTQPWFNIQRENYNRSLMDWNAKDYGKENIECPSCEGTGEGDQEDSVWMRNENVEDCDTCKGACELSPADYKELNKSREPIHYGRELYHTIFFDIIAELGIFEPLKDLSVYAKVNVE